MRNDPRQPNHQSGKASIGRNGGGDSHQFPRFPHVGDIEEIADRIGPHVRLKIGRVGAAGPPTYLGTMRADEFSLEAMLDTFGGGEYRVRAFDGRRYIRSFTVYLDMCVPPRGKGS